MAASKFIQVVNGVLNEVQAKDSSAGAGDAGKIVALDAAGRVALNMMPAGVGPENQSVMASETIADGDFVSLHDVSGTLKARKADATDNTKLAHGYVLVGGASGSMLDVFFDAANTACTGLTAATRYFLSATTPGKPTTTPPSGTGKVVQELGMAFSATTIAFRPTSGVVLA